MSNEAKKIRLEIERLKKLLVEKRSDICDILQAILDGKKWEDDWVEHRYIIKKIKTPNGDEINLFYDTLTTCFSYTINDGELIEDFDETYED